LAALRTHKEVDGKERQEIQEFAKQLFMEADKDGNHIYSYSKIAEKIKKTYGVKYTHITIFNWATNGRWQDIFEAAIKHGEKQAIDLVHQTTLDKVMSQEKELMKEQEYKQKLAQIKKAVYLQQAYAAQRAKQYLETLATGSGRIPNAVRALTEANKALFEMLEKSPFAQSQNLTMNIKVLNKDDSK
jgi:hypothetical protein